MPNDYKTIRIRERVLKKLHGFQWPRESISSVIERIVDATEMRIQEGKFNPPQVLPPGENGGSH